MPSPDLSGDPHGAGGRADGDHCRDRPPGLAQPRRDRPQHRRRHSGARDLSRRHRGRDFAFHSRRAFGADPGAAADPDLDPGEPLARRARHAAAMGRAAARARRRGADPARPADGRAGRLGLAGLGVSLVSITLGTLYQRRYCSRIDWRTGNLVQYVAVTVFFGAARCCSRAMWCTGPREFVLALVWLAVVLSIGSIGLLYWLIRRQAATSVASLFYLVPAVTAADGLRAVRRTARCRRHDRHGGLRRRGVPGQPAGVSLTGTGLKTKPPGFHPEALRAMPEAISASTSWPSFSSSRLSWRPS